MRSARLQRVENGIPDELALSPELMIPKTEFFDPQALEEMRPFGIRRLPRRMAVLESVKFD
jgi:hypothetical protein